MQGAAADTGSDAFQIEKSLRLTRDTSSTGSHLKTGKLGKSGNLYTWTWSGWVKRNTVSGSINPAIFVGGEGSDGHDRD